MIADIPLEDTPDFEYIFEDVVRLQEFDLYHVGLGLYRFECPVIYSEEKYYNLEKKYPYFNFFYIQERKTIRLLFVMSALYNITNIRIMENALWNPEFASMIPRGYDDDIDRKISGNIGSQFIESSYSDYYVNDIVQANRLLGFRWEPEQYYDENGRRRYIMIGGCVAKLIATGLYAFQKIELCDANVGDQGRYPLIKEQMYAKFSGECAVIGSPHFSGGSISVYEGTEVRYIAFEKIGINYLKRLYECTTGYEFRKVQVFPYGWDSSSDVRQCDEKRHIPITQTVAYEIEPGAEELIAGIGFEKIRIYDRVLFHRDVRAFSHPRCYDFAYMKRGLVKLVEISSGETKAYSIPREVFAELYVVQRMQICSGITEDILVKVIDNTDFEKSMLGNENYNEFFQFMVTFHG